MRLKLSDSARRVEYLLRLSQNRRIYGVVRGLVAIILLHPLASRL